MGNSLTKQSTGVSNVTFSTFMASPAIRKKISEVVQGADGQRFITAIISTVATNPKLAECNHFTIFSAALLGESLKLSPSPQLGQYYLVPYKNKNNGMQAQFQLGYKGYIQLAIRSGQYRKINVLEIKEGELISFDPLSETLEIDFIKNGIQREQSKTIGYYVSFELINGFRKALYWSYEKMLNHADKYSQAFSSKKYAELLEGKIPESDLWKYSSFWYKNFDEMAKKTMLRQIISKWGVMSIELQTAFKNDTGVIQEDNTVDYVDENITGFVEVQPETEPEKESISNKQEIGKKSSNLLDGVE